MSNTFYCSNFLNNFNGNVWGHNGPGVITRVMKQMCHVKTTDQMTTDRCNGVTVYPSSAFYAVTWQRWRKFFMAKYTNQIAEMTKDSFAVHLWNRLSADLKVKVGSRIPYDVLAESHCPRVYKSFGEFF